MARLPRPSRTWIDAPAVIVVVVVLLLLAGIGVIIQSEAAYRDLQQQETRVQAEILAASVTAALDFEDAVATREAVSAIRVNRQVRSVGIYNEQGNLVAGYGRDGPSPPSTFAARLPAPESAVSSEVPVMSRGERIGTVVLTTDPEPLSRRLTRYLVIGLLIIMAALVVSVLGVAQSALRRANRQLEERADALADANAELKVQVSERGKAEEQLRQAHKMQALGQLTGGIAHDFNNLLTVIQGSADMLRRPGITEEKRIRFAEAVVQASARAAALTGQLLAFARRQPLQPEVIDINVLIRDMTDLLDRTLGERIEVTTALASTHCTVEADRAQLESALLNIAVNARDAMPEGGQLDIRTAPVTDAERGQMIALSVSDSGTGMSEDTPGSGTTVTLLLPRRGTAREKAPAAESRRLKRGRSGRILLVEDNVEVGEFAAHLLGELGHKVVRAQSGEEALERALTDGFDLVFTDVVMPGMSGLDLAAQLAEVRPDLPVILTTGYSDEIATSGAGGRPVILKPYKPETLSAAIEQALAQKK